MTVNVWIKPAGTETWHLFQKNLPASLCGLQFEGMMDGPNAIVPKGADRCNACMTAAGIAAGVGFAGSLGPEMIFGKITEALKETVGDVTMLLFFQQHSAAALGAILAHPEKHGVLMIDDAEIEHVNYTEAAHLAHIAAGETWAALQACAEHAHTDETETGSDKEDLN